MTQSRKRPILDTITLMAYVDGELDEQTTHDIEALIANDEEARAIVLALRQSAGLARAALNPVVNEPVPTRLTGLFNTATASPRTPWKRASFGQALAASIALLVVGALGGFSGAQYSNQIAVDQTRAQLARFDSIKANAVDSAMERTPSGTAYAWQDSRSGIMGTITPIRTFRDNKGRYCREYKETNAVTQNVPASIGIACRSKAFGKSHIEADSPTRRWSTIYRLVPQPTAKGI